LKKTPLPPGEGNIRISGFEPPPSTDMLTLQNNRISYHDDLLNKIFGQEIALQILKNQASGKNYTIILKRYKNKAGKSG
jgi:hypothetical protein